MQRLFHYGIACEARQKLRECIRFSASQHSSHAV
jgi:hypothetical protein